MKKIRIHVHDDAEKWITLKKGEEGKGVHVKIDGQGNVVAGLGGKKLQLGKKGSAQPKPPGAPAQPKPPGPPEPPKAPEAAPAPAPTPEAPKTPEPTKPAEAPKAVAPQTPEPQPKAPKPKKVASLPKLQWLDAQNYEKRTEYLNKLERLNSMESVEASIRKNSFETACIIDRNGMVLSAESQGAGSEVSFNRALVQRMYGNVLTHNHPSDSSLSGADFYLAGLARVKEMRAVSSRAAYSLKPAPGKEWPNPHEMRAAWEKYWKDDKFVKKNWKLAGGASHAAAEQAAKDLGLIYERIPHNAN